jgi:hypothetical protein
MILGLDAPTAGGVTVNGRPYAEHAAPLREVGALLPGLLVTLVWRRRAPFAVFAIIFAVALAQLFASQELTDDAVLLVAFYTVAAYEPPRRVLAAAVALEIGAVLAVLRYVSPGSKQVWFWVLASVVVAAAGRCTTSWRTASP